MINTHILRKYPSYQSILTEQITAFIFEFLHRVYELSDHMSYIITTVTHITIMPSVLLY